MPRDAFDRHLDKLFSCRACPTVEGTPVSGPVRGAKILLVGQAPGPREENEQRPFAYTAGRRLFEWFAKLGVPEETFRANVYIAAVARCFPGRMPGGGDRAPSREEISTCAEHLRREIDLLRPELIIAVGTAAAGETLGVTKLSEVVGVRHRAVVARHECDVVVLPHPSGRSTWLNKPEHRDALDRSLALIATHRAFAPLRRG
jgi:uracil-DNA glycosylase